MKGNQHTLVGFINRRISIIYLIVLLISLPLIYFLSTAQLEKEVSAELRELTAAIHRSDNLLNNNGQDGRFSDEMAGFLKSHENYFYRFIDAGLQATHSEIVETGKHLVNRFHAEPALKSIEGSLSSNSLNLFYIAEPIWEGGANRVLSGVELLGINLNSYQDRILVRVLTYIGMMTIIYAIIISSINTTLRNHVINPLLRINNRTRAVANGAVEKVFETQRKDEVGELIRSIELLRRSLGISMEMVKSRPKE